MAVEIDLSGSSIPGLPKKMEIKNAAEEATLKELLKVLEASQKIAEKTQQSINKLAGEQKKTSKDSNNSGGGNNGTSKVDKQAAAATMQNARAQNAAAKSTSAAAKATATASKAAASGAKASASMGANMLKAGGAVGLLAGAVGRAATEIMDLGGTIASMASGLSQVGDSMSNASRELSNIPLVGTFLAKTLGAVADNAERVYGEYTKLASIGATFGGSMTNMIRAASGAGLTMEQFNAILKNNSEALIYLGGTTESGAKQFAALGKAMKQSQVGNELLRMGFTTEQVNDGMASYVNIMGRTGALQNMTTQQIAQGSANYLKDLDALAKITGEERAAKQKEREALLKDAQFRARMATLSEDQQREIGNLIQSVPKEHQAAVKDMVTTGRVTSQEASRFAAMMPQAAQNFIGVGQALNRGEKLTKGSMDRVRDAYIDEAKYSLKRNQNLLINSRQFDNETIGMAEAANRTKGAFAQAAAEQAKTNKAAGDVEKIAKFKQQIAETGNKFTEALMNTGALDTLLTTFQGLANFTSTFLMPVFNGLMFGVGAVVNILGSVLSPVFSALGVVADGLVTIFKFFKPVLDIAVDAVSIIGKVMGVVLVPILGVLAAAFLATTAPITATVLGLGLLVGAFKNGIGGITGYFEKFGMMIGDIIDKVLSTLPKMLGGISKEEAEQRKALRDTRRKEIDEKQKTADITEKEAKAKKDNKKATEEEAEAKKNNSKTDKKPAVTEETKPKGPARQTTDQFGRPGADAYAKQLEKTSQQVWAQQGIKDNKPSATSKPSATANTVNPNQKLLDKEMSGMTESVTKFKDAYTPPISVETYEMNGKLVTKEQYETFKKANPFSAKVGELLGFMKVTKPTNVETYEINGKLVTKEQYDEFIKKNPQLAAMMKDTNSTIGPANKSIPANTRSATDKISPLEKPQFWSSIFDKNLETPDITANTVKMGEELDAVATSLKNLKEKGFKPFTSELLQFTDELADDEIFDALEDSARNIGRIATPSGGRMGLPFPSAGGAGGGSGAGGGGGVGGGGGSSSAGGGSGGGSSAGGSSGGGSSAGGSSGGSRSAGGGSGVGGGSRSAGGKTGVGGGGSEPRPRFGGEGSGRGKPTDNKQSATGFVEGNPSGDNPIKNVLEAGAGYNIVERPSGAQEKMVGARNWRNNNPGNIENGSFAKGFGSLGGDPRFAIFPDFQSGRKAKSKLIFDGKNYKDLDLKAAIARYAPPSENDTTMYQNAVLNAVGGQNKRMAEYSESERNSIMAAMEKVEGFKVGKTISMSASVSPKGGATQMPKMAAGGITSGPSIAGEAGAEAVVPLPDGRAIPVSIVSGSIGKDQTAMIDLLSALNSKMEQLIFINGAIADLNNSQLRVQKNMKNPELLG
jgi:uncharacterized coiled-coil protein SlyX